MSFTDIFSLYSAKVSPENRAKTLSAQPDVPGNVLYTLSNVLEEDQKTTETDIFDEPETKTPAPEAPDFSAEAMNQVLSALSGLDSAPSEEKPRLQTLEAEKSPPLPQESPQSDGVPEFLEVPEANETEELEAFDIPDDFEAPGDSPSETSGAEPQAFDMPEAFDTPPEAAQTDVSDDEGLGDLDLFGGEDADAPPPDNSFDLSFNLGEETGEFSDTPNFNDELVVESPEELARTQKTAAELLESSEIGETEMQLPDFSGTEIAPADSTVDPMPRDNAPDIDFSASDEPRFDLWKNTSPEVQDEFSHLNLNEEQIFTIRDRINSIQDKSLRFELRNAILEPQHHAAYYDELVSMLLVNAQESRIAEFLYAALGRKDSENVNPAYISKKPRAIFHADDVENFEHFKEDFTRTAKRISAAAFALITLSVILWTSVAQPLRIENLYKRGLTSIRQDKFTEGESLFNRAQQVAGRPSLKWHLDYGKVYEDKKMVRLAEQKYRAALIIAPKDIPAAQQAAAFYTNLTPPDFNSALGIVSKLVTYHPRHFGAWDFFGNVYMNQGDTLSNDIQSQNEAYFNAAGVYRDFIIKNINNIAPYYRLLDIYIKLDDITKIKQIYSLIDQLDPKDFNIEALSRLAGYYIDRKELSEAERIFRRLIPYIDTNIGKMAQFRKKMDSLYNINASMISNVLGASYYEFARYNMLNSDVPRAIRLLTNALAFSPSNGDVYNLMGEAFLIAQGGGNGRIEEAKKHFDTAARLNPRSYKPQVNLGHVYFYYERETAAIAEAYATALYHYRLAQNLKPAKEKNFLLNYNSGWLEYRNGNFNDALALWSDIYKDEPGNPILSYALGSVLYHMQNPRLSQVEFQKAASSYSIIMDKVREPSLNNPRHVEVYSQMARVKNNIGVINANYASANPGQRIRYEKEALINFYAAKDASDRIRQIYNNAEYNILVLTHPAILGRTPEFDNTVPKSSTINNKETEFKRLILDQV